MAIALAIGAAVALGTSKVLAEEIRQSSESREEERHESELPIITLSELAKHTSEDDAWMAINGEVYDVSSLLAMHPGGSGILTRHAGIDASAQFASLGHNESQNVAAMLPGLHVGHLEPSASKKSKRKRVVIVGAGICGLSTAFFLSHSPALSDNPLEALSPEASNLLIPPDQVFDITVVDSAPLVGGTGLRSSAIMWIGPLLEKTDKHNDSQPNAVSMTEWLGHVAYDIYDGMQKYTDVKFTPRPTVGLIENEQQLAYAQKLFGVGGRMEGAGEFITDPVAMKELEPEATSELAGMIVHRKGATVDPFLVCDTFAQRAAMKGVKFEMGFDVQSLVRRTPDSDEAFTVRGVRDGKTVEVPADVLVVCVGWKARPFFEELGHVVPVDGVHGQMFAVSAPDVTIKNNVYSWQALEWWGRHRRPDRTTRERDEENGHPRLTNHLYGLQIDNGIIKFGGDRVMGDMNSTVLPDGIQANYEHVTSLFPRLKGKPIIGTWGGTLPFTPDQRILCGPLEANLFVLTGSGFMRGPASGLLLADSIRGRKDRAAFLKDCDPLRFAKKRTD